MLAVRAHHAFDGEKVRPGGAVVLVERGRIVGVEPIGFTPPDGCEVVDSDGTVLPGLINAHVHLCGDSRDGALERLPEFTPAHLEEVITTALHDQLASGVTTVRDLGDPHWSVVDRRDAPRAGEPHIVASGPPITSVGGHCWMMGGEVAGVDALRAAVRERAERRVDVVKIMASGGNMTPGTDVAACQFTLQELRAVVDESHRVGLRVTARRPRADSRRAGDRGRRRRHRALHLLDRRRRRLFTRSDGAPEFAREIDVARRSAATPVWYLRRASSRCSSAST